MNAQIREARETIKEYVESKPEGSYKFGLYITKVGTKYVHVLNLHEKSKTVKVDLITFLNGRIKGIDKDIRKLYDLGVN